MLRHDYYFASGYYARAIDIDALRADMRYFAMLMRARPMLMRYAKMLLRLFSRYDMLLICRLMLILLIRDFRVAADVTRFFDDAAAICCIAMPCHCRISYACHAAAIDAIYY